QDGDDRLGNYSQEIGSADNPLKEPNGSAHTTVDWSGWKIFQVPLNIATTDQAAATLWTTIKQVRLTVINPNNAARTGTLMFGRISVVGTRFQDAKVDPSTAPVTVAAFAENNQDNPGYPSLVS